MAEIEAAGGRAVVNGDDVADWAGAQRLVQTAIEVFGGLDVVVNNAGFVRDRMFVSCAEEEWDAVVRVHLKGHFCVSRHAAAWWRDRSKAGERRRRPDRQHLLGRRHPRVGGPVVVLGGQGRHRHPDADPGGRARPLRRHRQRHRPGRPHPHDRGGLHRDDGGPPSGEFDAMAPDNVSPLVVWLGSSASADVTGRLFEVEGGKLSLAEGWHHGPAVDKGARWDPSEIGAAVRASSETPAPPPPSTAPNPQTPTVPAVAIGGNPPIATASSPWFDRNRMKLHGKALGARPTVGRARCPAPRDRHQRRCQSGWTVARRRRLRRRGVVVALGRVSIGYGIIRSTDEAGAVLPSTSLVLGAVLGLRTAARLHGCWAYRAP